MILNFFEDYILENERVKLMPLQTVHAKKLVEISEDESIWAYFLEKGNGIDNLTKYIANTVNNRKSSKEYPFIIFDKVKNRFAGTTRFYDYSADIQTIKLGHTWIGKDFQRTGLNKNCKYLLFEFAFEKLKIERVGFGAHADNKVSIAAMKSVGCKDEGILRNFIPSIDRKGRANIVLLSILKNEWFNSVKIELKNKLTNKD